MEHKKHPRQDITALRGFFLAIGILVSLIIILIAFEHPSKAGPLWKPIDFNMDDPDTIYICVLPPFKDFQDTTRKELDVIYLIVEDEASFPGGEKAWTDFLRAHYKPTTLSKSMKGSIFLSFTVDQNGKLSNVRIARGVHPDLDKAMAKAIALSPDWNPAKQNGKVVKSRKIVKIDIPLE